MKKIIKTICLFTIFFTLSCFTGMSGIFFKTGSVSADVNLQVDFHVPLGAPIFTVDNMLPGDSETRKVNVINTGTDTRMLTVKGINIHHIGEMPQLAEVLNIVITEGSNTLYGTDSPTGPKTLENFFSDSVSPDGITLSVIGPESGKEYKFKVTFPQTSGNSYQQKGVVFDLLIGIVTGDKLLINEVYYQVHESHGVDSTKDRNAPTTSLTGRNVNTGARSKNIIKNVLSRSCEIVQSNNASVENNVTSTANTGNNSSQYNTIGGRIITGAAKVIVRVITIVNNTSAVCITSQVENDEWVELYNPNIFDISLKGYSLTDNSGKSVKINENKIIKAGDFALISANSSTWKYWSNENALTISLGTEIGDGLDNAGDRLILKNPDNIELDRTSWGEDTSGFSPPGVNPKVALGSSTSRIYPGLDTDTVSDWHEETPPSPGY